jgi:GNAT superfamily N-acetyltransferase
MLESVQIYKAAPEHIEILTAMINRAFAVEKFFIAGDRADRAEVEAKMRAGVFLLAELGGEAAGCVFVELRAETAYFGLLAVEPEMQGRGIGQALISAAEEYARRCGKIAMDIRIASPRTELPPFYRKLGYADNGVEDWSADSPPTKMPCHFIKMIKTL